LKRESHLPTSIVGFHVDLNSRVTTLLEAFPPQLPAARHAVAPRASLPLKRLDVQITSRSWSPGGFLRQDIYKVILREIDDGCGLCMLRKLCFLDE